MATRSPFPGRALRSIAQLLASVGCTLGPASTAQAAGGGGRLLIFFFAMPVLLPVVGMFAARIGLRRTEARGFWWSLCALLALNSALLGGVYRETSLSAVAVLLTALQLAYACSMVVTRAPSPDAASLGLTLFRAGCVLVCGALPALLTALVAR